jgi:GDP-L-fucose synthase
MYPTHVEYDLTSERDVVDMYNTLRPRAVVHLAAKVGGIISHINNPVEFLEHNILMNTFMVKHARLSTAERFIGVLSCCIFPDTMPTYPLKEEVLHDGPPSPSNFTYGMAKRVLAVHIDSYNKEYGTKYNYLTPCNMYGEFDEMDESKSHYLPSLIKKIYLANKTGADHIVLFGDGTPIRQMLYAKDLARAIKMVIDRDITESFNVVPDGSMTIDDIARCALRATNSTHLRIEYDKSKPNGHLRKDLDNSKFKRSLPDFKFTPLEEGLREYYKNFTL